MSILRIWTGGLLQQLLVRRDISESGLAKRVANVAFPPTSQNARCVAKRNLLDRTHAPIMTIGNGLLTMIRVCRIGLMLRARRSRRGTHHLDGMMSSIAELARSSRGVRLINRLLSSRYLSHAYIDLYKLNVCHATNHE